MRRGLFRLWIVASFVWLVSAGALFQKEIRRDVSVLTTEAPQVAGTAGPKWYEQDAIVSQAERDEYLSHIPALPPGYVLDNPPWEDSGIQADRAQGAQDNLMLSAIVLLLPPILAFALGWAGLWIMRGFRS